MTEPIICTEGTPLGWTLHVARNNQLIIRRIRRRMRSRSDSYSVTEAVEGIRDGATSELVMCTMYAD